MFTFPPSASTLEAALPEGDADIGAPDGTTEEDDKGNGSQRYSGGGAGAVPVEGTAGDVRADSGERVSTVPLDAIGEEEGADEA